MVWAKKWASKTFLVGMRLPIKLCHALQPTGIKLDYKTRLF